MLQKTNHVTSCVEVVSLPCGIIFRITLVLSERRFVALFTDVSLVENYVSMLPPIIVCILPTYDDFGNHR